MPSKLFFNKADILICPDYIAPVLSPCRKIVVIHGVGEGVLRHEIRKELDIYHPYFEYYDASYDQFGYGATEIRLIKNPN